MDLARIARYGAFLLVLGSVVPSHASPVLPGLHQFVITGGDGWSGTAINWIGSEGYTVTLGPSDGLTDFFTFDLTSLSGTADGAVLRLVRYWTGGPVPFTYLLADPFVLYGNLWPGSLYGGIVGAGPGALGDILEIPLNADGLAAINASRGMFFNMGGMLLADPVADSPESATLLLVVGFWGGRRKRGA